ncbi:peptidoglycan-associated lipoprotein Pal [Helicobacter anseris]|uniref:Peptidoglycan-associated lipoprotein Pal n=1 Tax=Helicobacter anseris TaxID=375926 RepID=A0A3D8JB06_9HELI|nr:peptidoglycan-associated lipoprotein Pal [Helicobacter anseris]RDU74669.1 peptidoglycan-associated lipoprotein Pal [Helicobacter anseris]
MKKVFFSFLVVLLFAGCAKKAIMGDSDAFEEEAIQPNVVEALEEPLETKKALADGTVIASIFFDFDKFEIRSDMQSEIDKSVDIAKENDEMKILIEGNTDEFGSDEYNFALGNKRALAVKTALITRGVDKKKMQIVSFGKTKPLCTEKTNECYQKNRRGDIRLLLNK